MRKQRHVTGRGAEHKTYERPNVETASVSLNLVNRNVRLKLRFP